MKGLLGLMLALVVATGAGAAPALAPNAPAANPPAMTSQDLGRWIDAFMPYAMARGDIAGGVVVVVKDRQVIFEKGYGYADVRNHVAVDPVRTLFRAGSISKLYTWTAVMQLVEQHRIDLDQDINAYLDFKIPPFQGKPVTMRNLMTHTAGFEETGKNLVVLDRRDFAPLASYIKHHLPARFFPPGEVPAYSNYGAALAGYIVERISGQHLADYIQHNIFAPLHMTAASFEQPLPASLAPQISRGYLTAGGQPQPFEYVVASPAGGLSVTGHDMAQFMLAHLEDGEGILRPETAREMHDTLLTTITPNLHRMALGFFEQSRNAHYVISHGGDTRFFHSWVWLLPNDHVGLFVAVNSLGSGDAVGHLREGLFEQFTDRYFPPASAAPMRPVATAAKDASSMTGAWLLSRGYRVTFPSLANLLSQVTISSDARGRLTVNALRRMSGAPMWFEEVAPHLWKEVDGQERLAGKFVNGKAVMAGEDQVSMAMVLLRPSPWLDGRWLLPTTLAAMAVALAAALLWPIGALVRRHYGRTLDLTARQILVRRVARVLLVAALLVLVAWFWLVTSLDFRDHQGLALFDPCFATLRGLTWLVFPGAAVLGVWNLVAAWGSGASWRRWAGRLWSVALALAPAVFLWVAVGFHLFGFTLVY